MKVKKLYIADIKVVTKLINYNNFSYTLNSESKEFRILEKKYFKESDRIIPKKRYVYPGTNQIVHEFYGQKEGETFRSKKVKRLTKICDKKDISIGEIRAIEKRLNKK